MDDLRPNLAWLPIESKNEKFINFERADLDGSIVDRLEKQVFLYPHNLVLKQGNHQYSYHQFNQHTNQIAYQIHQITAASNVPIAFLINHGIDQIITIFGILKSGNAYLALDPSFPKERLSFMVSDSETPIIITNNENLDLAAKFASPDQKIFNIDEIDSSTPSDNLGLILPPDTKASLYYTSGSTGNPKGAILPHSLILHHIMSLTNRRYINPDDRFVLLFSASYAAAIGAVFGSLLNGAALFPYDIQLLGLKNLANFLLDEKITIYGSVPSTFRYFASSLKGENLFPDIRLIYLGGDTALKKDIDLFKKYFSPTCYLENTLAGTEFCTIRSNILSKTTHFTEGVVPVGYEIEDKDIVLIDDEGLEVPTGKIGEITIRTKYIAQGYWHRPDLTESAFKPVPGFEGKKQYSTGDLGIMRPDGCLEYLGRKDRQVKIRGHRVEIGEITSALYDIPFVKDAFVKSFHEGAGEIQLVAYLVPQNKNDSFISDVQKILKSTLPSFMIPTEFIVLDEIPKTPSGKVETFSLPDPQKTRSSLQSKYVAPGNEIQAKLVEIWENLLKFQPIGIADDFFELGGHSLLALRLIADIEDIFDVSVPFPALAQIRTIMELAATLEDKSALKSWSHLVPLQPLGSKTPLFLVPPSAVTVMIFQDFANHFSKEIPLYALEYAGMDAETSPHDSIVEMAAFNLEKIRSLQPEGPYNIGGMCFGGLVAYEMAKQLLGAGEKVSFLGILDSTHSPYLTRPKSYPVFMFTRFLNQKILKKNFPIGMAPLKRAIKKFSPEDEFSNRVYDVFTAHNYARVKYVTTPYPGKISLFNTVGSRGDFSRDQWREVAHGGLDIVSIPGSHSGMRVNHKEGEQTFIREPMVQILAQKMVEILSD